MRVCTSVVKKKKKADAIFVSGALNPAGTLQTGVLHWERGWFKHHVHVRHAGDAPRPAHTLPVHSLCCRLVSNDNIDLSYLSDLSY